MFHCLSERKPLFDLTLGTMYTDSNYRAELIRTIPNITLNQYNTLPSPPLTTSYTSMTPVHFGQMMGDRDTPISGTVYNEHMEPCSEYSWLSANGSMNLTSLWDLPSTSQPVMENNSFSSNSQPDMEHSSFSSFSSHDNSIDMLDPTDMFQSLTEPMDMFDEIHLDTTVPQDLSLMDTTSYMLTDRTPTPPERMNVPGFVPKRRSRKPKIVFEHLGPEATVKEHLLQLASQVDILKDPGSAKTNLPVAQERGSSVRQILETEVHRKMRMDLEAAAVAARMNHNQTVTQETDATPISLEMESQQEMRNHLEDTLVAADMKNNVASQQEPDAEWQFLEPAQSPQDMRENQQETALAANMNHMPTAQETTTGPQLLQMGPEQAVLASPMAPLSETSLEQYRLELESRANLMMLLREQAASGVPLPLPLSAPLVESPLAPIQLPQLPMFPFVPPMYVDVVPVPPKGHSSVQPEKPAKKERKERKKQTKPRSSRSGKPLGRPLGSFKKKDVFVGAPVSPLIVAPIPVLPVIPQPILSPIVIAPPPIVMAQPTTVIASPVPEVIAPVPPSKPAVACPSLPEENVDGKVLMCMWESCGRQFINSQVFYNHVNDHITYYGNKLRVCLWDGCRRNLRPFDAYHKVQVHIRVHTNETPYSCDHPGCDKTFKRQDNLRNHILTHSDQPLFKCNKCKKKFLEEDEFRGHEKRAHLGKEELMLKKRFVCLSAGCEKRYSDFAGLKKHVSVNHPELIQALEDSRGKFNYQ